MYWLPVGEFEGGLLLFVFESIIYECGHVIVRINYPLAEGELAPIKSSSFLLGVDEPKHVRNLLFP